MIWHSSEVSEVLAELSVDDKKGLANGVADMRLEAYGKNAITNIEKPSFAKHFTAQLNSKYVYILTAVALLSFIVSLIYGESGAFSPLILIGIVLINAFVSAYQLFKSDNALNSLKSITNPIASVLRDGIVKSIPSDELVPGDIIFLKEGDYISADARLIEVNSFRCNESVISGITVPVEKKADTVLEDITPLEDRVNMVFAGCSVIHGNATAIVVETGLNTESGRTSALIQQTGAEALPLQSALDNTSKIANVLILIICVLTFIIGMIQNFNSASFASMTLKTLLNSVALAVAAIPEGLPAISTVVIALGIQRIMSDDIIIKKTSALETVGRTTVICSDKTGILTRNKMNVSHLYDGAALMQLDTDPLSDKGAMVLRLAAACSTLDRDSTERAIKNACIEYNSMAQSDVETMFPRLCIIPFDSERKTMTSINMINGRPVAIVKGAPESLIEKCVGCNTQEILKLNDEMAENALRVVCIAIRELEEIPSNPNPDEIECNLTFAGLIGITDPPRDEAINGIKMCETAGIRTIMITGDNLLTAKAIARRIGILKDGTLAVTGAELENMSDEELETSVSRYSVFARISPADKLRIINALKANGETVTVTGDSLSDSDSLFAADVGCAMGRLGTDVAKGNADIITASNSFMTLVRAIKESRGLFANIKRSVSYLLSCNFAELTAYIFGMIIFGMPPLAAAQLLCINLLTDCAPAVALSTEKPDGNTMEGRSKTLLGHIFDPMMLINISAEAVFMAAMAIIAFAIGKKTGDASAMSMAFVTLASAQIFHAFNLKTTRSVLTIDRKSSHFLMTSTVITLFTVFFLALTPVGSIFGLGILGGRQFVISVVLAFAVIPFCEIFKIVKRAINK